MRYEEKYKEALERAKKLYEQGTITESLNYVFPELKESEDEKIRNVLVDYFKRYKEQEECGIKTFYGIPTDNIIAWLEKQGEPQVRTNIEWVNAIDNACNERYTEEYSHGEYCHEQSFKWGFQEGVEWLKKRGEQKIADKYNITGIKSKHAEGKLGEMIKEMESANKVEPKFKVGDWIYHEISGNVFHINRIENRTYISDEGATISFDRQNDWRLWTIQDAKDGDVLAREPIYDYPSPFIAICKERGLDYFNSYCFIGFDAKFYTGDARHGIIGIHPATKEQRDTLMKVMSDAGYEWDTEKKELKKIEQKPAWSEEDEKMLDLIIAIFEVNYPNDYFKANELNDPDMKVVYTKEIVTWLKSLKDRYTWKPSDEQLKQLRKYCPDNTALTALYEYLKQL